MTTATMMERYKAFILIVEDDADHVRLYGKALKGYRLHSVSSTTAALEFLAEEIPDLIVLDHILEKGQKGTDLLPVLKTEYAHVPVIIVSGTLDIRGQLKALQGPYSAQYIIEKPVDVDDLTSTVEHALEHCGMAETIRSIRSLERAEMLKTAEPERLFVERLARQHELLQRIRKSSEKPNISQLAREFRVSRRTIARDLQDLVHRSQLDAALLAEQA